MKPAHLKLYRVPMYSQYLMIRCHHHHKVRRLFHADNVTPDVYSPVPAQPGNGEAGGIINTDRRNSEEGIFRPKAPDLEELRPQENSLPFESDIKASIVHFHTGANYFVRGTPTIQNLLYRGTPAAYMANLQDQNRTENPDFRWIHLPANNMSWVEVSIAFSLLFFILTVI